MRSIFRAVRHVRSASRPQKGDTFIIGRNRKQKALIDSIGGSGRSAYTLSYNNKEKDRFLHNLIVSRALSIPAANETSGDVERAGPFVEYERRIAMGELMDGDTFQVDTLRALQRLYDELVESVDTCQLDRYATSKKAGRSRWLWSRLIMPQSSYSPVKGLYLFGGVGTGKTMLMDLFYNQLPCNWRKKRIHFHDFMLTVHSRLQRHKGVADPLDVVAGEISDESMLLCLDEFMVTDVADALILNRLFGHLFSKGIILVSTSNRAPDRLYEGGLQRDLFLPFIASLKERCIIHEIGSSTDYRKMTLVKFHYLHSRSVRTIVSKFALNPQELKTDF